MDESGNAALTVGQAAPHFELTCTDLGLTPRQVRLEDYRGRWLILVFYPRDFSFVCPTELTAFSARVLDFQQRECGSGFSWSSWTVRWQQFLPWPCTAPS